MIGPISAAGAASSPATKAVSTQACLTATKAIVATGDQPLHATAPTPAVNAKKLAGKTVIYIAQTEAIGATIEEISGLQAAANALHITLQVLNGNAETTQEQQDFAEAIALHPAAIISDVTASFVGPQLAAAHQAGIPVVDDTGVTADKDTAAWGLYAVTGETTKTIIDDGYYAAAKALASTGCTGTYVEYYSPTIPVSAEAVNGVTKIFKDYCPSKCAIEFQPIAPTQLVTGVGPLAQTYITRFPNLKAFLMPDQQLLNAYASIHALNWQGKLIGYFDNPFTFGAVRDGEEFADISGNPEAQGGWADMDEVVRALLHKRPIQETANNEIHILTASNVPPAPATDMSGEYGHYADLYEKAWGLQ
jgi:ABC-type sugar transport system substrate-binding protein